MEKEDTCGAHTTLGKGSLLEEEEAMQKKLEGSNSRREREREERERERGKGHKHKHISARGRFFLVHVVGRWLRNLP